MHSHSQGFYPFQSRYGYILNDWDSAVKLTDALLWNAMRSQGFLPPDQTSILSLGSTYTFPFLLLFQFVHLYDFLWFHIYTGGMDFSVFFSFIGVPVVHRVLFNIAYWNNSKKKILVLVYEHSLPVWNKFCYTTLICVAEYKFCCMNTFMQPNTKVALSIKWFSRDQ